VWKIRVAVHIGVAVTCYQKIGSCSKYWSAAVKNVSIAKCLISCWRRRFPQHWIFRFWVMVPCSLVGVYLRFGGICCLKLQVRSENDGNKLPQVYQHFHLPPMRIYSIITQLLIYIWP
jgi:hypothetical protein